MARVKTQKPQQSDLLDRINRLQMRCQDTLSRCEALADCDINMDEEIHKCQERLQILAKLKAKLFPEAK